MTAVMQQINQTRISLYWDDLKKETQDELLQILDGDNRNWDTFPIATIDIQEED